MNKEILINPITITQLLPIHNKEDNMYQYLQSCHLINPYELPQFSISQLANYSTQIECQIEKLGSDHMIPLSSHEALTYLQHGLTILYLNPTKEEVLGFIKVSQWKHENITKVLEVGSLFVDPTIQGNHIGQMLVEKISHSTQQFFPHVPIISVVDSDNMPSLKLFRKLQPEWHEKIPENPSVFIINSINILEGWGKPSSIFIYQNTYA